MATELKQIGLFGTQHNKPYCLFRRENKEEWDYILIQKEEWNNFFKEPGDEISEITESKMKAFIIDYLNRTYKEERV